MMMLAIVQSNPQLAKSSTRSALVANGGSNGHDHSLFTQPFSDQATAGSPYILDTPVDMTALNLEDDSDGYEHVQAEVDTGEPYMFIPPDPRGFYRALLGEIIAHDHSQQGSTHDFDGYPGPQLLSKPSVELLREIGTRWRLPLPSRLVLLLDVVRDKFAEREIDLDTLDTAFLYFKDPPPMKGGPLEISALFDRTRWTIADYVLNQQILASVHDVLLRDLFEKLEQSYDPQPLEVGPIMTVLESHIYDDELFSRTPEDLDRFSGHLQVALRKRASECYHAIFAREISQYGTKAEFFHIIQLGKAVVKMVERADKRFRKVPQIMGYVTLICERDHADNFAASIHLIFL